MIEPLDLPYIGQPVNFHPDEHTRYAAIVVEVYQDEMGGRPEVALQVFLPDGKLHYCKKVKPVRPSDTDDSMERTGRYSFSHEIYLDCLDGEEESRLGTQSNHHVSMVNFGII